MAGYSHLATLTLLAAFVNGFWCRTWPNLEYYNMDSFGWEMSVITGVNSLDFTDNFMIPMRHDPMQIMVGNGNGYSPSTGEGCIQIYYLRNRTKSVRKIAGKCSRHIQSNFRYKNGYGLAAELMWPDHGYMTKDRQWILFVDNQRCARRMRTRTFEVLTVIGSCHNGLNHGSHGTNRKVIGMVFLDEKNLWVFFMSSGLYIYPWSGATWRQVSTLQTNAHNHFGFEPGMITKGTYNNFKVFQKLAYGVTSYDFTDISMTSDKSVDTTRIFNLRRPYSIKRTDRVKKSSSGAIYNYNFRTRNFKMSPSNGHVSQHPYYHELLMVTDWKLASIFLLNTGTGDVRQYCSRATGSVYIFTTSNEPYCRFTSLKSTMWVGGSSLSALVVDRTAWLIHQIMLTNNMEQRHNRCDKCWHAPGSPTCYDTREGVNCVCSIGYEGSDCDIPICSPSKCNGHGQCTTDVTNRVICMCTAGWRGERCNIQRYFLLDYVKNTVMQIGVEHTPPYNARVGSGFLLKKLGDPSVLIVGHRQWDRAGEGAIGYYRLGRMSNFVYLAGNLERRWGPSQYNDGIGTEAHMVVPLFAYQQLDGEWLHFVDTWSCVRRLKLKIELQVLTWLGVGRCGNGTLDMSQYGTRREVTGMTMLEFSNRKFFVFSGPFGIYLSSIYGSNKRLVVSASEASAYSDVIYGSLTKESAINSNMVYHNTPYGITAYDFDRVTELGIEPSVTRVARLKPYTAEIHQFYDTGAIHSYDNNQEPSLRDIGGVIEINPSISNLLMVADKGKDSVILYNITTGNLLGVCRKHSFTIVTSSLETCRWSMMQSAMWLTPTTALVSDYKYRGRIYVINFRVGADDCASAPCGPHGICSDSWRGYGFECLCHDDWSGSTCSIYSPRTGAVFPVLGAFDEGGHLMSMGTSRSETFSILMFAAALTSCYLHLSEHH